MKRGRVVLAFAMGLSVGAGASACEGSSRDVTSVELELSADGDLCPAEAFARINSVAVEVYGVEDEQPCVLARRCTGVQGVTSASDVENALRALSQPLVQVRLEGSESIGIVGHTSVGCGGERGVCGAASLMAQDEDSDALALGLDCQWEDRAPCEELELPLCGGVEP